MGFGPKLVSLTDHDDYYGDDDSGQDELQATLLPPGLALQCSGAMSELCGAVRKTLCTDTNNVLNMTME